MRSFRASLVLRILVPVMAVVAATVLFLGGFAAHILESEVRRQATEQAAEQQSRVLDSLQAVNALSGQTVHAAIRVMMNEGAAIGAPSLGPGVHFGVRTVPDLRLGGVSQTGNFALVDRIRSLMGGTATLFVRSGDTFVRVSTNVMRPDGTRAVGTVLDPKGRAWAAIAEGRAFYGVVDILGKPYMTAYEPMRDRSGAVIGIWYAGYPLEGLAGLGEHVAAARILDNGFLVLEREDGSVVLGPQGIAPALMDSVLQGAAKGWTVSAASFPDWHYRLVAAWPASDIARRVLHLKTILAAGTAVAALLMLAVVWIMLRRLIVAPVLALAGRMESADLNTVLHEERSDEIGRLANAFDHFVLRLRSTLVEVSSVSAQLTAAASSIAASAAEQARVSAEQSTQTGQVVLAMEEITGTISQVSESSERASGAARQTVELAHAGRDAASHSAATMKELASAVEGTSSQIADLAEQSERIGRAVTVIDEIAGQTNLLALNAAIEAARAGEAGRGFAVVAGEVRRLAERTTHATREIGEVVGDIQEQIRRTVDAIAENRDAAGEESRLAAETGSHLDSITEMARQAGEMIMQIATVATEQAASAAQVRENVDRTARLEERTAEEARRSAEACESLSTLAAKLQSIVAEFRLREHHQAAPQPLQRAA